MKAINLKNLCLTTSLLVGLGGMSSAQADTYFLGLVAMPSATDVFGMTCPAGTAAVQANVDDFGGPDGIHVSVQIVDPQGGATRATAPDGGGFSPTAILAGAGAGNYLILVNKGQFGLQNYTVNLDCYDGMNNPIPGFQSAGVQNQ